MNNNTRTGITDAIEHLKYAVKESINNDEYNDSREILSQIEKLKHLMKKDEIIDSDYTADDIPF